MEVVGLTGGIGCGKSTVAALLARRGVPVIDADALSREVVAPGTEGLAELVAHFGRSILQPDGSLDRKKLGARVFGDPEARRKLEEVQHPRIVAASLERMQGLAGKGKRWCIYEAALLVETGRHRTFSALVVVTARASVQRVRLLTRDGLSEAEAEQRLASQLPLARKVAQADWAVDNSGTREGLERRVAVLYADLVLRYGPPGGAG